MKKMYKYKGLLWEFGMVGMEGPYCSTEDCGYELRITVSDGEDPYFYAACDECGKKVKLDKAIHLIRLAAEKKVIASERIKSQIISLDLPPTNVGAKDHDENYWISARIGQKNGKKFAVVYLGEQTKKQNPKDKVQFFIDLEDDEVRHDPNNMNPADILAAIKVQFRTSTTAIDYH